MEYESEIPPLKVTNLFFLCLFVQVSNEKNPGCLGYIEDYTAQLYGDYNKPLYGSLLNNQYNLTWPMAKL